MSDIPKQGLSNVPIPSALITIGVFIPVNTKERMTNLVSLIFALVLLTSKLERLKTEHYTSKIASEMPVPHSLGKYF